MGLFVLLLLSAGLVMAAGAPAQEHDSSRGQLSIFHLDFSQR
jgi:hypothetical protein